MATVKKTGKVRVLVDAKSKELIYPVTVGDAVVVDGKPLRVHVRKLYNSVADLEDRSRWK